MMMEQWRFQKEFTRELKFYLQVEKHVSMKVSEFSLYWNLSLLCSIICLSTIYFITCIKVGSRLYLTTLKLYQFNKTKLFFCSYYNPIRMFLFRKPSTCTFHFVLPPFSKPLRSSPLSQ